MKNVFFLLILVIGSILLQFRLSRCESRWPGLILPGLCVLYSFIMVLNFAALPGMTAGQIGSRLMLVLLLCNIPTLVYAAIYASCRQKRRRSAQLNKMQVLDLD